MADEISDNHDTSLDKAEVGALLESAPTDSTPRQVLIRADGRRAHAGTMRVEPYDFRNPVFLSEVELRRLRSGQEDFIRYLSARLSLFLRMEFGLKLTNLNTTAYAKFTESLVNPTHVCLFKAEPLSGVGILSISPRLALAIADRLLGGRGQAVGAERDLTEIETALIEDILKMVLEEWCAQWKSVQEITAHIIGHETGGRYLQTSPKDAAVLVLSMEANFGDCAEAMQIALPFYTLESLIQKLQSRRQRESSATSAPTKSVTWKPAYDQISMPVRAEWNALEMTLRELTSLRVGDLLELPASLIGETQILLNGSPKFIGAAGLDSDRVAVQISRKITSPESINQTNKDGNQGT